MKKYQKEIELLKYILLCTLIFMVVAHGYCYTNLNFSHDSMRTFFWTKTDTLEIGRFVLPLLLLIRGKYYPPLLIGTLTYLILSFTIYLIVKIFNIKEKISIALASGILATASTLTLLNATYIDFSDMYMFAVLLMTIGAYFWQKYKYGFIYAIIPVFIGLGIYQSYICFFIGIVMLISIKKLIEKEEASKVLKNGLKAIATLLIALIMYAISLKIITLITGISLANKYNSVSNVGDFGGIGNILLLIKGTYQSAITYIINPSTKYKLLVSGLNIILGLFGTVISIYLMYKNKIKKESIFLLITLIGLLPFGINIIYFIGKGIEHELMIYALFLLFIYVISMLEIIPKNIKLKKNIDTKYLKYTVYIIMIIIIFSGIIYSNECYLKKQLEFDATLTAMNRIVDRIEQTKDYEPGKTPVAIIGNLNNNDVYKRRRELDYKSVGLGNNISITYYKTYKQYFENYLGYSINLVDEEELQKYIIKNEVKEMDVFPKPNYVKMIDQTLIVKLSDVME